VSTPPSGGTGARRVDIDWLRIIVVLSMVPFHVALVFTNRGFMFVKSGLHSPLLWAFVGFIYSWAMPLLFFVSGVGAWFSLKRRSAARFLWERTVRLAPPSLVGLLVLVPLCAYLTHRQTVASPLGLGAYLARHFANPQVRDVYWGHVWFLVALLVLAFVLLPALVVLRLDILERLRDRFSAALRVPGALLLAAVPIAAVAPLPSASGLPTFGWGMIAPQGVAYLIGFLLASHDRLREAIDRSLVPALVVGAALGLLTIWVPIYARRDVLPHVVFYLGRWAWVLAAVGLAQRFLHRDCRARRYVTDAGLALYLLHVPVASLVAYGVIQTGWPIACQFLVITAATYLGTIAAYEVLVRRWNPMRRLFGLRPRNPRLGS